MFTFINSFVLPVLAAVTIPVLIHLFNRQRAKRISFSSIRFLKILEKKRLKNIKIYQYLLILIRTLILLFLIVAFARPTFIGKSKIFRTNSPATSVIILDNGINMSSYDSQGNRYKRAFDQLRWIINLYHENDQKFILTTDNPHEIKTDIRTIDNNKCSYLKGDWETALNKAKELFSNNVNYNKELFIISDFNFNRNHFIKSLSEMQNVHIHFIKIGKEPVFNIKIDTLIIKSYLLERNKSIHLDIILSSLSQSKHDEIELNLFVNEQRVAHKKTTINPLEKKIESLSFQLKTYGIHSGYVELSDDNLLADNRYYFSFTIPRKLRVLFIDDNPSLYLEKAIETISENTNIVITKEKYYSWAKHNFNQYDVIFLSNLHSLPSSLTNRIKQFLKQNGGIIISPGMQTIPSEFNNLTKNINQNIRFDQLVSSNNSYDYFTIKKISYNHPLFSGLFRMNNPGITEPIFYQYFKISPVYNGESIISFNTGDPFLYKYKLNSGSIFLLSSYIDEQWTDLQYKGIFTPLLLRLFYSSGSLAAQMNEPIKIGDETVFVLNQIQHKKEYFLKSPDDEVIRIIPEVHEHELIFKMKYFFMPGQYILSAEKQNIAVFSANIASNSITLPFLNLTDLKKEIPYIQIYEENQDYSRYIFEARTGNELWKIFISLVIICLIIEIILVKRIEGKAIT